MQDDHGSEYMDEIRVSPWQGVQFNLAVPFQIEWR